MLYTCTCGETEKNGVYWQDIDEAGESRNLRRIYQVHLLAVRLQVRHIGEPVLCISRFGIR
jgi:hypothetical protein